MLVNIGIAYYVYEHQYIQISIMRGLWPHMSGPIRYVYTEMLSQSSYGVQIAVGLILGFVVEVSHAGQMIVAVANNISLINFPSLPPPPSLFSLLFESNLIGSLGVFTLSETFWR